MSMAALSQRFARTPVPPVPPREPLGGTAKPLANQGGSPGSPGSPENNNKAEGTEHDEPVIPTQNARDYRQRRTIQIKDSRRTSEPINTLSEIGETSVCAWLDAIGETDPSARAEYLKTCASDPDALAWTLAELAKRLAPSPPAGAPSQPLAPTPKVCCRDCRHFEPDSINPPSGLGDCRINAKRWQGQPPLYPFAKRDCRDRQAV